MVSDLLGLLERGEGGRYFPRKHSNLQRGLRSSPDRRHSGALPPAGRGTHGELQAYVVIPETGVRLPGRRPAKRVTGGVCITQGIIC